MTELFKHDMLLELCKNKSVLHIGATSSPYHCIKEEKGELLHQKLQKITKTIIGIDVDREAIKYLKLRGISDIYYGDIVKGEYEIELKKLNFDIILMGDVIEHLDNPGIALKNLLELFKKDTMLILTTPNVMCFQNIKYILLGKENVHPDHTFWPSYKTMRHLFYKYDLNIKYFTYCLSGNYTHSSFKRKVFYKITKLIGMSYLWDKLFFILIKNHAKSF